MKIFINNVEINGDLNTIDQEKKEYEIKFTVLGKKEYHLYSSLFENKKLNVIIPELNLDYEAERVKWSSSYEGTLEEDTPVLIGVGFREKQDEEDKWTALDGLFYTAIHNWVRTRALAKVLIDKGLMEHEEYEKIFIEINQSDFEEMKNFILTGERKSR